MNMSSEATKVGIIPPTDPAEFDKWRKSLDPDSMGFDGKEVGELDGNKKDSNTI